VKNKLTKLCDTDLALLAKDGNHSAFEVIYDRHASGVARTLASFSGPDQHVLDDLTQDVFMKVVDNISSYVPSHPFAKWLYTIALNTGRNHIRRQSKIVLLEPNHFDTIEAHPDPEMELSRDLLVDTLMRFVSRLPDSLREVVSLRIGSDLRYAEIAGILNIAEGTARSRMHTALKTLRHDLGLQQSKKESK
jgi:RNA polymerase sigma-70 factor (ECF subfamily)